MSYEPETSIASRGHNLVGVQTGWLSSVAYNDNPTKLSISGTRESHHVLFDGLDNAADEVCAGQLFQDYMEVQFGLARQREKDEARRFRASYLRLLKDWGFDSNSPAGAVLKGWVESRFGLFPTFHKVPIRRFNSPAWIRYMEEKMSSRFDNNTIYMQFDLLYEFCQWAMQHFHAKGQKHLLLYRGANDLSEQQWVQKIDKRAAIVRLNNLVSFTSQRAIADEFGDTIIEAQVPVTKILFYNDLLQAHPLRGEAECLVIGGDYRVKTSYW